MELVELMGHARGEGRASLAAMSGKVEGLGDGGMGHLVMVPAWFDGSACLGDEAAGITNLERLHRVSCFGSHSVRPPAANRGGQGSDSELDRFEVGSGIIDVRLCHVVGNGIQDAQQFGTSGGTVQKSGCKVKGHGRIVSWLGMREL